jgi:rare lipoprotein A
MRLFALSILFLFSGLCASAQQAAKANSAVEKKGTASYYHPKFEGRPTATGEVFDNEEFTAACNKLKLGTYVKVTNLRNDKVVYVRINDRMAANNTRLIDLASVAAEKLEFIDAGLAKVKIEIVSFVEGQIGILAQKEISTEQNNEL